jgi:hypothetical protein
LASCGIVTAQHVPVTFRAVCSVCKSAIPSLRPVWLISRYRLRRIASEAG